MLFCRSMYFLCCSMYFCVLCIVCFVTFPVLFVCICVLNNCHRVATQLQLNISYHIKFIFLCVYAVQVSGSGGGWNAYIFLRAFLKLKFRKCDCVA